MKLKRNIKFGITIILVLGGLYFGLRFSFGLFTPFNFWTARQDISRDQIKIIELGELPHNHRQMTELANSFGVEIYYYGCNNSIDIRNGVRFYNNTILSYLDKKYNSTWWKDFHTQLDSMTTADSIEQVRDKMISIVLNEPLFVERKQLFDSIYKDNERHLIFTAGPSPYSSHLYLVKVSEDNGINLVTHFNFLIDNKTLEVINHNGRLPDL